MNKKIALQRRRNFKLAIMYIAMFFSVIIIVASIIFLILGYRLDLGNGQIEQYSFLQFNSTPTGATITLDGVVLKSKTPSKISVPAGVHEIIMKKDGYRQWQKTIDARSGTLNWLDYALLIPEAIETQTVASFLDLNKSLASDDGKKIIIQENKNIASFKLIDITNENNRVTSLDVPINLYSIDNDSIFNIDKWDKSSRFLLISHQRGQSKEWLVIDTQNILQSKNITNLFNISFNQIEFYGESGFVFLVNNDGDIRKIDLSSETISKPLVSSVASFNYESDINVITFKSNKNVDGKYSVGVFRENSDKAITLKTSDDVDISILSKRYYNEDYVVINNGENLEIYKGTYSDKSDNAGFEYYDLINTTAETIKNMIFSYKGQYLLVKTDNGFISYDIEHKNQYNSTISGDGLDYQYDWLDGAHIWSNRDKDLTIREFDGRNLHTIGSVMSNQAVAISYNKHYIYVFVKTSDQVSLQRLKLLSN